MKSKLVLFLLFISALFVYSQDMVRINVNSNPSGASFTFTGSNNVYTTPTSLRFSKSLTYSITFTKPGYESKTISYRGGTGDIFVKLETEHSQEPPQQEDMVRVNINSNPSGASFTFTGSNNVYNTPTSMRFSRSMTYNLTFSKPGYESKTISYRGGTGDIFVKLDRKTSSYFLSVKANINGALVFINGRQYGKTPLNIKLEEGSYNITVKAGGYRDYNTSVNMNSNQSVFANLEHDQYTLSINSNVQGATVTINGRKAGNTPYNAVLNPGNYNIRVSADGYKTYSTSVNMSGDQNIYANLEPERMINIKVPQGAKIYINGKPQQLNWGNSRNPRDRKKWKTFTFYADSNSSRYNVKIDYYELVVEKSVEFNGATLTLFADFN